MLSRSFFSPFLFYLEVKRQLKPHLVQIALKKALGLSISSFFAVLLFSCTSFLYYGSLLSSSSFFVNLFINFSISSYENSNVFSSNKAILSIFTISLNKKSE